MHIKTTSGKITNIHIERWDHTAIPANLETVLRSFQGRSEEDFLSFAFTQKLFLYTKILYILREDRKASLYLWAHSPLYGSGNAEDLEKVTSWFYSSEIRYATFTHPFDRISPKVSMLGCENVLSDTFRTRGAEMELVKIKAEGVSSEDLFSIFGLFNLTRNGKNEVLYFENDSAESELKRSIATTHSYVVALNKAGALKAYTATDLLIAPHEELREFLNFYLIPPNNDNQAKSLEMCRALIEEIVWERQLEEHPIHGVSLNALKAGRSLCLRTIGTLKDLPDDFQNIVANLYYQLAIMAGEIIRPGFFPHDASVEDYFSKFTHIRTCTEVLPEYVSILRRCRDQESESNYKKLKKDILGDLRYGVNAEKLPLSQKLLLHFKKPIVSEIPNLYQYF